MNDHHALLVEVSNVDSWQTFPEFDDLPQIECKETQLGIGSVRELIVAAHRKPTGEGSEQLIVIRTESITEEAQHALLKIAEEPPSGARFIFVVPIGYYLLPTLQSRLYKVAVTTEEVPKASFAVFCEASVADRLTQIDEAIKSKDMSWQREIKSGLLHFLHERKESMDSNRLASLEYIVRTLLTRGASNKYLLEHLALVLEPRR